MARRLKVFRRHAQERTGLREARVSLARSVLSSSCAQLLPSAYAGYLLLVCIRMYPHVSVCTRMPVWSQDLKRSTDGGRGGAG